MARCHLRTHLVRDGAEQQLLRGDALPGEGDTDGLDALLEVEALLQHL
jgi:hypothetical protein